MIINIPIPEKEKRGKYTQNVRKEKLKLKNAERLSIDANSDNEIRIHLKNYDNI